MLKKTYRDKYEDFNCIPSAFHKICNIIEEI